MQCSNPNYMRMSLDSATGATVWKFMGPARFLNVRDTDSVSTVLAQPFRTEEIDVGIDSFDVSRNNAATVFVPCGKCPACRSRYARNWSHRMAIEFDDNGRRAVFVTLTYRPADLPVTSSGVPTLNVRDCQLFLKRLRKHFTSRRIRYYLCGEYGSKRGRPHYHLIIFGLTLADFPDAVLRSVSEVGSPDYDSKVLYDIWSHGRVGLSDVNLRTFDYVARYTLKKLGLSERMNTYFEQHGTYEGCPRETFNTMSRRPGIGLLNVGKLEEKIKKGVDMYHFSDNVDVHSFVLPSSIFAHLRRYSDDAELLSVLALRNIKALDDTRLSYLDGQIQCNDSLDSYLCMIERQKRTSLKLLPLRC